MIDTDNDLYLESLKVVGASQDVLDAAIRARTEDNFVPKVRYSYKWKVECETHRPLMDYVFAADHDEAIERAYERLDIPEGTPVTVYRVNENNQLRFRLNAHK